jgi:cyclopropane fatty-acyl-phospholipid synthase-like methyltransferase
MARIVSDQESENQPRIDEEQVSAFFEERARKIQALGPVRAVIYQDRHPDLAERRDRAEKARITPLLALDGGQRLLDIGCGTGRWVSEVAELCSAYHGADMSEGLVAFASQSNAHRRSCRFSVCSITNLSLPQLNETAPFDRILCAGVLIYLNDDQIERGLSNLGEVAARASRIVLREPLATGNRLTLRSHYSEELDQVYNAIYRTEGELLSVIDKALVSVGFEVAARGDVYDDPSLNNRAETRQRWLVLDRKE